MENELQVRTRGKKGTQQSLSTAVRMWPTPTKQDASNTCGPAQMERNTMPLNVEAVLIGGETTQPNQGKQLSPMWTEWLMGWPIGWTDLQPLATDKFRLWLRLHGQN